MATGKEGSVENTIFFKLKRNGMNTNKQPITFLNVQHAIMENGNENDFAKYIHSLTDDWLHVTD